MIKLKIIIYLTMVFVSIFTLGCSESSKQNQINRNNEPVDLPNQKQDNNILQPNNLLCILKEINNSKVQADLVFDNNIHKKHLDNNIRGYKYIWNIYGKKWMDL